MASGQLEVGAGLGNLLPQHKEQVVDLFEAHPLLEIFHAHGSKGEIFQAGFLEVLGELNLNAHAIAPVLEDAIGEFGFDLQEIVGFFIDDCHFISSLYFHWADRPCLTSIMILLFNRIYKVEYSTKIRLNFWLS